MKPRTLHLRRKDNASRRGSEARLARPASRVRALALGGALTLGVWGAALGLGAQPTNGPVQIDLPTALRLAGAQNLEVQIARERLAEARARHQSALLQFFPSLAPGITYRQHNDKIQDTSGSIVEADKFSYAPGATLALELDVGEALFTALAAKQLARAAHHALDGQRQDAALAAAQSYFDLARAHGAVEVAAEAVRISAEYESQLASAVEAGLAFKGDLWRARVQVERNRRGLHQAREQQRVAAARLAQVLHLDPTVELVPRDSDLVPLALITPTTTLDAVVARALGSRPELKQHQALAAAARDARNGAKYGPLIPRLGAQAFWGGLGGGHDGVSDSFGPQADYLVGASWRIGPGGLFDFGRIRSAEARWKVAGLNLERLQDEITGQAVEAFTRWRSLADQLHTAQRALAAAAEGLRLAQQRREFAVGVVLETIQAEEDLTRTRLEYLGTVAEFNQVQYTLRKLTGDL